MRRYITAILALTRSYLLRFTRDKSAMFFTFLFPLLFLFVFGSLYSNNSSVNFNIALLNHSDSAFSKQFAEQISSNDMFTVETDVTTFDGAREGMARGEIDSVVELPQNFGQTNSAQQPSGAVTVYYSESNPQVGQTLSAVMQSILDEVNTQLGQPTPPLSVESKSTAISGLSQFDYVFSGLIGFSILSLGIFGLANQMPAEKKTGVFRRLRASPITKGQLVFANMLYYLLIGIVSIALMFAVGMLVFNFQMRGDWFQLVPFIILSVLTIFGFGLAIGGWARNETQSGALTNIVSFPLMFLSGVFFPRFLMPDWLQGISGYLPLTPIIDGLRMIMTEAKSLIDIAPELGLIAAWAVVIYFIAVKTFRWE